MRSVATGPLARLAGLILSVFLLAAWPAEANGKRVALVIGNGAYQYVSRLPNPVNDAEDVAASLRRLGFAVSTGVNLDYNQMRLTIRDFGDAAADAEIALVYYAGHGIEIDNTNYLIPVNAELKSDRDVDLETIRLDTILGALGSSKGVKIVLVDACRNNPFLSSMVMTTATRSIGRGLGRIDPGGVMVGYSARGGTVSLDGDGRNSPYAEAVLKHLEEPGLEIGKMFRRIRDSVLDETGGAQEPFTYGSLPGEDIFFVPPLQQASLAVPAPQTSAGSAPPAPQPVTRAAPPPELSPEEKAFSAAKAVNTPRSWAMYFQAFPEGAHRAEALAGEQTVLKALAGTIIAYRPGYSSTKMPDRSPDLSNIGAADAAAVETWLGFDNTDVLTVQAMLKQRGFYSGPLDGSIGPGTRAALRGFQATNGIVPTGLLTWSTATAIGLKQYPDGQSFRPDKSSTTARSYDYKALEALGEDPRLFTALTSGRITGNRIVYGQFQGHLYIAVANSRPSSVGYLQASLAKIGGHLVTITSKAENDFVVDLIRWDPKFWSPYKKEWVAGPMIGFMQKPGSREPAGGWEWVTGEPVSFVNWARDMPNNNEKRASIGAFGFQHPQGPGRGKSDWWRWDDYVYLPDSYILEFE